MSSTSLELIGFSPSELAAYLSQPGNRHVVNEDRWYGMTHLHDACVKGSPAHVQALVRFGADVSAANAGGETPLHLGARRGIVAIAEELRKAGADLHARDQSGRTALHFAAFGNNPSMLNYLIVFGAVDLTARDKNGDTFLHLLCQNKKVESVYFCLKAKLFSASELKNLRNSRGQTPFDVSLEMSTAEIPYLFLSLTEFSLLSPASSSSPVVDVNGNGGNGVVVSTTNDDDADEKKRKKDAVIIDFDAPCRTSPLVVDPAALISNKAKRNPSFAQLNSSIAFHRRFARVFGRVDSRPLLGPLPAYSLLLVKPVLGPPLLYLLCRYVLAPRMDYAGGLLYLIALYFAWMYKSENYRMNDVSKWPNPFMASLFFSGIFCDLLVFFVAVLPAISTTTTLGFSPLYVFAVATTLTLAYQYVTLIRRDPGRVPPFARLTRGGADAKNDDDDDAVVAVFLADHCPVCRVAFDSTAHVRHCRLCGVCMRGFDHHCLFLLSCVAKENRRLFLSFLLFVDFVCIPTFLVCIGRHLSMSYFSASEPMLFRIVFDTISISIADCYLAMLIILSVGNWVVWMWIAFLIYNQIYYVARAHTTSCVGVKSCREDLNVKLSWKQLVTRLVYFLTKGEMMARNVCLEVR